MPMARAPTLATSEPAAASAAVVRRAEGEANALRQSLLAARGEHSEYLKSWATQILPMPLDEVPPDLLTNLPTFSDARLDRVPLPEVAAPLATRWLDRQPSQETVGDHCPRSYLDLYDSQHSHGRSRVKAITERWLAATLEDLACIEAEGPACERRRPRSIPSMSVMRVFTMGPFGFGIQTMSAQHRHVCRGGVRERVPPRCFVVRRMFRPQA